MSPPDSAEGPAGTAVVRDGRDALVAVVARDLLERLSVAQGRGEVPQVALTGGSVADALHRELARLSAGSDTGVDWSRVEVFWGDERFLPAGDPERNETQAREALLDHVGVDPARVHPMPSADDAADVHEAADRYAETIHAHGSGSFEVVMLGLGPDAHIASLFPGHPGIGVADAVAVGVTDSPKPPPGRVSLTLPALARTRAVWFVASGSEKADAVALTRGGGAAVDDAPGTALLDAPEVRWYLDAAAAG